MVLPAPLDARQLKNRADMLVVASHYTRLKRSGRQSVGLCPLHPERHPSFYVDSRRWYCFGCQRGGDLFAFLMAVERCAFPEALRLTAKFLKGSSAEGRRLRPAILSPSSLPSQFRARESFADVAGRIVSALPSPGAVPRCSDCGKQMVFKVYQRNRFGGTYYCAKCSCYFGPRELRQVLLQKRGSGCEWCAARNQIEMHHLSKRANQYDPAWIVLLCSSCRRDIRKVFALHAASGERRSRKAAKRPLYYSQPEPRPYSPIPLPVPECAAERAALLLEKAG